MRPLRAGQEGFAGNSTPLYMYSNPGAWASLMGVDYVRNNKAKGIDYSTMHVYTDQWLCVAEGATTQGQLDFMKQWIEARIQAAEEELEMPVVLEEFGSKLDKRWGPRAAPCPALPVAQHRGACRAWHACIAFVSQGHVHSRGLCRPRGRLAKAA